MKKKINDLIKKNFHSNYESDVDGEELKSEIEVNNNMKSIFVIKKINMCVISIIFLVFTVFCTLFVCKILDCNRIYRNDVVSFEGDYSKKEKEFYKKYCTEIINGKFFVYQFDDNSKITILEGINGNERVFFYKISNNEDYVMTVEENGVSEEFIIDDSNRIGVLNTNLLKFENGNNILFKIIGNDESSFLVKIVWDLLN